MPWGQLLTLDGVGPSAYRRASNLIASSCLTCDRYLLDDQLERRFSGFMVLTVSTSLRLACLVAPQTLDSMGS